MPHILRIAIKGSKNIHRITFLAPHAQASLPSKINTLPFSAEVGSIFDKGVESGYTGSSFPQKD